MSAAPHETPGAAVLPGWLPPGAPAPTHRPAAAPLFRADELLEQPRGRAGCAEGGPPPVMGDLPYSPGASASGAF